MTPEQLDEIESRWYIAPDFQLMFAAVREAWAERDEAIKDARRIATLLDQAEFAKEIYKVEMVRRTRLLELKEIELP